ncbi:BTAD domain-containing putative transcriptional regulator [Nonomuraea aurantiaca]|uniref:BTAD domain-containing putative transcriptional regulator n=1 Tax=Nonomuraea aurantiaca TaxID=2878562 RepID=UPI001CD9DF33|nr:BTAD domain-containing putative transcriptional regulator [Nonomuraea aurantiaca]MCA2226627.1 AAA family ATPase [Nonomuraea aurantiaca]
MLLGPFEMRADDGRPIEIPGTRLRALLARLALEAGRVVPVEVLTAAVWGEEPPAGSANALQALVSRTRRLVGAAAIESLPPGYRLAIEPEQVDVTCFERLASAGDLAALRAAESLWRGPALAEFAGLPFAANEGVRLAELRLSAAEARLELELAEGADVLGELRPLAAAHPLRERLQGLLMRALYAAGRQADALEAYERTRRTLAEELGVDPSAKLAEVHLGLLRHDPRHQPRRRGRRTNLRAQVTSFVGREEELAQLAKALEAARLVTVVGPGGAGKTRLATEVAQRSAELAPDGVWLVELAAVREPLDVAHAVLTAIGARDSGWFEPAPAEGAPARDATDRLSEALDRLSEALDGRRVLLVLDNCEHVVAAVAHLADRLLGACPDLRVLATSRESMAIGGESLYPIPPLEWPAGVVRDPRSYPAVRLFAERAALVRPGFVLDEDNTGTVVEICGRLDGMPLAIELAAARMRALSVEQIAAKLDDRFRLLSSGSRTALPRHQTLQAVVDWSWDLLSGRERELAMLLAAFPGGATLDALEAVSGPDTGDVLDVVTALVDKSLVEPSGERYRMQETVRSYGMARLSEAGQDRAVRDRHARQFLRLAETADPELRRADQLHWLARLRAEDDNLLAALRFAAEAGDAELGVRLLAAVWWFWYLEGRSLEGMHWARGVLDLPGEVPDAQRPVRLVLAAFAHHGLGAVEAAQQAMNTGLELRDRLGEEASGWVLLLLAPVWLGDPVGAARSADRLLPRLTGWERATTLMMRSIVAEYEGDVARAFTLLDEARRGLEDLGERWALSSALRVLAEHHARRGDLSASIDARLEALRLAGELGIVEDQAAILAGLAITRARLGELDRAQSDMRAAWDFAQQLRKQEGIEYIRLARAELLLRSGERAAARRELDAVEAMALHAPVRASAGCYRAMAALLDGDADNARPLLDTAIELAADAVDMPALAGAAHLRAALALADGDPTRAAHLLGLAAALRGTTDLSGFDNLLRPAERARALLGEAAFATAYDRGALLTRDAAIQAVRGH